MSDPKVDEYLADWTRREENAEAMVPMVGRLFREHGVIVKIFGIYLVNKDPVEILKRRLPVRTVQLPLRSGRIPAYQLLAAADRPSPRSEVRGDNHSRAADRDRALDADRAGSVPGDVDILRADGVSA